MLCRGSCWRARAVRRGRAGWRMTLPSCRVGRSNPSSGQPPIPGAQTTLAVIATDAPFTKAELAKLAQMAHDGLALAIRPTHTPFDGDVVFALSTARDAATSAPAGPLLLAMAGGAATHTLARAVAKAIHAATGLHDVPALRDLPFAQ